MLDAWKSWNTVNNGKEVELESQEGAKSFGAVKLG